MNEFIKIINISMIAIFAQNVVLERALGTNILMYATRKPENIKWLAILITYITGLSSVILWFMDKIFEDWAYYRVIMPIIYILTVGLVYIFSLFAMWRFMPKLLFKIRSYVHLCVFNCAVLGALFVSSKFGETFPEYIFMGVGTGAGFLLAGFIIHIARPRLNSELIPAAFRGLPITFIYLGVISLALYALTAGNINNY